MSGFRLAGGDDIAVLVLFTGGTTSSSLERGNELRGEEGRHHITHHRLSLCKAAHSSHSSGLRGDSHQEPGLGERY